MTTATAIDYLKRRYGTVEVISTSLFRVTKNRTRTLYRLINGYLEHRVDLSNTKCAWEPIEGETE